MSRKNNVILSIFVALAFALSFCGSRITRNQETLPEPDRIVFHCNDKAYFSDREYIRAMGEGNSRNESMAHRMADLDASANLAKAIENYLDKIQAHKDAVQMKRGSQAVEWEEGSHTRTELSMTLSNVATICSESHMEGDVNYVRKIVEIPVATILNQDL